MLSRRANVYYNFHQKSNNYVYHLWSPIGTAVIFGKDAYTGVRANTGRLECLNVPIGHNDHVSEYAKNACLAQVHSPGSVSTISFQSLLRFVRVFMLPDSDSRLIVIKSFS
jgi:hypothetical protein